MADGICHALTSDLPFAPPIHQYPLHLLDLVKAALSAQEMIGWKSALKGYFAKQWAELAQLDMHTTNLDSRKGELRMKQIIGALSNHIRRLWSSRNSCLHDTDSPSVSVSAETIEITYYHSRPHMLRLGDQHYCNRPLSSILSSNPATRRRWLRKVKKSSAELTKDDTRQSLLTSFFRPVQS